MAEEKSNEVLAKEQARPVPARMMSPFEEMERLIESVFPSFFPRGWLRPLRWEWPSWSELENRFPKVDVIDRDNEIVVRAEVPGVDKKDLEVTTTDNTITIKGKTRYEEKEEKGDYYRCEISRGSFSRTLALPSEVDGSQAKASFKDGVLELTLPKLVKSRRVNITID